MTNEIVHDYIYTQLIQFLASSRCCQKFCGSFRISERSYIEQYAFNLRFKARFFICNGIKTLVLFKNNCIHLIESSSFLHLQTQSRKDLFVLLKHSSFVGGVRELQMSPDFCGNNIKPIVQPHRFSIGPLKQSMARCNTEEQAVFQNSCILAAYKDYILQAINKNRLTIIDSDTIMEKSVAVPMFLLEQSAQERSHCKIICVEREQLLAIYNSERLSVYIGEKVGDTVAYQVHLQSRISETSNIIYTTASFLLRVLMGQTTLESFHHISHVLINDIQLHDALNDILLCELKEGLKFHDNLKVVLLSNSKHNNEYLSYFGEGEEFRISYTSQLVDVIYLDEITKIIAKERDDYMQSYAYAEPPTLLQNIRTYTSQADKSLEDYNLSGSIQSLEKFLYLVHSEVVPVDYHHSLHWYTAANIAEKFGHTHHVQMLLRLSSELFKKPKEHLQGENKEICNCFTHFESNSIIDYMLINDIIRMVITKSEWEIGNILVLLPAYEHLIRLNYYILKNKLVGNLPQKTSVHLLHCGSEKDELHSLINPRSIQIVLATDVVETMGFLRSFSYVIDTARSQRSEYDVENKCEKIVYNWISMEKFERRAKLAAQNQGGRGICFRLITNKLHKEISDVDRPELLTMQLDRVCLTVKLLSQHQMIAEYFQNTIVQPPFLHIYDTVEQLKKLEIFDSFEDLTWLGCRLIDIPVDCHLGKLLVFGILLQCLDPILTIVSFLKSSDPLEFPKKWLESSKSFAATILYNIKQERNRLAEGSFSDHLIYIRLYQEWQNQLLDHSSQTALVDEHHFVLNGILEKICGIRSLLVGALRSSQLIHNQGHLSMHFINLKSNCWPVIKAALAAGLYPQICATESYKWQIKSPKSRQIIVHPSSVIRELEKVKFSAANYLSTWIVYSKAIRNVNCNNILHCTVVAPVAIAMFAGPVKIYPLNMDKCGATTSEGFSNISNQNVNFIIDEWIWFKTHISNAQLILKARQHFFSLYMDYLQHCGSMDKWRRSNISLILNPRFFDTVEQVLLREDISCGFLQPDNIGLRPKAVPNKLMAAFNHAIGEERSTSDQKYCTRYLTTLSDSKSFKLIPTVKQFFLVHLPMADDMVLCKYPKDLLSDFVREFIEPELERLTFVIIYQRNPDILSSVAMAKMNYGVLNLQYCFMNRIPINELVNICLKYNICVPSFNGKHNAFHLDSKIGNIILDLFANRNNWLHNL